MKILKNKGFLSIGITLILLLILGNYFVSYQIIINKNKRLQSIFNRKDIREKFYNLKVFSFDEIYKIDRLISSQEYKTPVEFLVRTCDDSKLWLKKSQVISQNGYMVYRIFFNEKLFYQLKQRDNFDFFNSMKKEIETRGINKDFIIEVVKYYQVEDFKSIVIFKGIIQLLYKGDNQNILFPDKEILKEIVIKVENQ